MDLWVLTVGVWEAMALGRIIAAYRSVVQVAGVQTMSAEAVCRACIRYISHLACRVSSPVPPQSNRFA